MFTNLDTIEDVTQALVARTQRCWVGDVFQSNEMRRQAAHEAAERIAELARSGPWLDRVPRMPAR